MTIAARLFLGFLISILLLIGVGVFALNRIGTVRDTTVAIINHDIWAYRAFQNILQGQITLLEARRAIIVDFMQEKQTVAPVNPDATPPSIAAAVTQWRALAADFSSQLNKTVAVTAENEQQAAAVGNGVRADSWRGITAILQQAQRQFEQLQSDSLTEFNAVEQGDSLTVMASEPKLVDDNKVFGKTLSQAVDALAAGSSAGVTRIGELYAEGRMLLIWAVVVAVVLLILIAWIILRSIIRPLEAFTGFAERVGLGDLTGDPLRVGRDELGRLGKTLNGMAESLRDVSLQSRQLTSTLNASAAQIRASTQEQAASVEQQLAALQETAATADEITHSGARISTRAQEVIQVAQQAVQTSANGLNAVGEAVRAMDAIREQGEVVAANIVALSEKTQAIGEIISTVNDVSERAHLLALNAAIEAAAAGENGRSFAVVASELKVLADQAKEATVQVRSLLGEIQRGINSSVMMTEEAVKRVAVGRERSDVTERTIEAITASVQESVQTFQQIVASTNQQQIGIEQVMGALQNIRQASQQTAAGTRELDVAASSLAELAGQLMTLGDRYKI
ncbi:methyl-accepting chemotaxis protein [Acidisoma cellulosilytica]|uniref:Methyl-accepting chemotaxis protein n=1 Tax=Acidisoma cellulosilyticum TaxID=2802395 RepID=A0A963YZU0_9PROT|nr:methyl-accepting chemotaxis protein [Acidisoma cellulosilyticum]MCB8879956.1 methyl-accepting chemotaxis protein [Acidisoma cellulosilyticum]